LFAGITHPASTSVLSHVLDRMRMDEGPFDGPGG
jgi:hypothetical protein